MHEQFGYAYDKAWNLNERTNNALVQTFAVNDVNELSSASQSGTLTVAGSSTEAFGNPGVTNLVVNGGSADLYGDGTFAAPGFAPANGENTYTAAAQDSHGRASTNSVTVNVTGGNNYTYDSNGNLTSDGTRNFAYNDENQLVAVWVADTWSNSFAYDGLQRKRIEQQYTYLPSSNSYLLTNEVHYIYDGNLVLQERDQNNDPMTTYTRGNDLSGTLDGAGGVGGLLARSDNEKIVPAILDPATPNPENVVSSYYFCDANGNVVALVSPSGMLLAQYEYDPFGNLISKGGLMADINKYRFSSKEWNENEGLYYYGYRFYDPNLQRWLNRDPIQEWGGINLFEYAFNAPQNLIDLFGLCPPAGAATATWPTGTAESGAAARAAARIVAKVPQVVAGVAMGAVGGAVYGGMVYGPFITGVDNWYETNPDGVNAPLPIVTSPFPMASDAGDQLEEISKAQENANKKKPSINDPDDDWDGMKRRPKQNSIRDISGSRQNAQKSYGSGNSCTGSE